eukprot:jgi/Mesvir1/18577/Mv17086-RA.1
MASQTLSRIGKDRKESVNSVNQWKFPGQGQRDTPVIDFDGIKKIVCLLPSVTHETAEKSKKAKTLEELMDIVSNANNKKRKSYKIAKGENPEKAAADLVEVLRPAIEKSGHYEEARQYRGPEFAATNKRLMLENQEYNRNQRIKAA